MYCLGQHIRLNMDLEELEINEDYKSLELAKNQIDTDLSLINLKDLYPEFEFADTYGLRDPSVPLINYQILYEQVIINIHPQATPKHFKIAYGITINEFIRQVKEKRILPVICYPYTQFPDFYKELFQLGPFPRSGRLRTYLEVIGNKDKAQIEESVCKIVDSNKLDSLGREIFRDFYGSAEEKVATFKNSFASDLYDFELLGMHELVDIILDIAERFPNEAYRITSEYCNCIGRPFFENAGGINTFTDETLLNAKKSYLKTKILSATDSCAGIQSPSARKIESFLGVNPVELINFLSDSVNFNLPTTSNNLDLLNKTLDKEPLISEMRKHIAKIKDSSFNNKTISDLSLLSSEISHLLKKDARKIQIMSKWSSSAVFIGSILPGIIGSEFVNNTYTKYLFNASLAYAGSNENKIKTVSGEFAGSMIGKIMKKPMATLYWKATK